jgi:hypothetical protein
MGKAAVVVLVSLCSQLYSFSEISGKASRSALNYLRFLVAALVRVLISRHFYNKKHQGSKMS